MDLEIDMFDDCPSCNEINCNVKRGYDNYPVEADLSDTVDYMLSEDYKDRLWAEYTQLRLRVNKLRSFIEKYDGEEEELDLNYPFYLFKTQLRSMEDYLSILAARVRLEGIIIDKE